MNVLVIGGAGYIGSFVNQALLKAGWKPIVLDNLSTGHQEALVEGTSFIHGDYGDSIHLRKLFLSRHYEAVIHLGGKSIVGESIKQPLTYLHGNVGKTIILLTEMKRAGIKKLVFSSTAAVYGFPQETPISERHPVHPISPYGLSKLMVENVLEEANRAHGIRYVSLRYFNAAGAMLDGSLGEDHNEETHLIPNIIQSAIKEKFNGQCLKVFGNSHKTFDGTCVRDYIHVLDLAEAHVKALTHLNQNGEFTKVFNLGAGRGYSVLEIIQTAEEIIRKRIPFEIHAPREGDPPVLVADGTKAIKELGWRPRYSGIQQIIQSAWSWHSQHPRGYLHYKNILRSDTNIGFHQYLLDLHPSRDS